MCLVLLFLLVANSSAVFALNLEYVEDGVCTSAKPDPYFNQTWFENAPLKYFAAGSKHHLYTMIWGYELFSQLREFEFYYYACILAPIDKATNTAIATAFNNTPVAKVYDIRFTSPGVLQFNQDQLPKNIETLGTVKYITMTDNETYIFIHICITNWNLKSWTVYATIPSLSDELQVKIQKHALALGHSLDDMIFYRYDSCNKWFNLLDGNYNDGLL